MQQWSEAAMRRIALVVLAGVFVFASDGFPLSSRQGTQSNAGGNQSVIVIPAGTTVSLALASPILASTAKAGNSVYAQTDFPVAIENRMAIPAGTYVQGVIDSVVRPAFLSPHAQFQFHFTKLIFANGYSVELEPHPHVQGAHTSQPSSPPDDIIPAVATPYVDVSSSNDVLLDTGSEFQMILQLPLRLNASSVALDIQAASQAQLVHFQSASLCRPIPGWPGTSGTVIPGTPGTPGTPPTVIPGAPGTPPTVIPGTPGTPGTPATVIPGTSGFAGVSCPGPPLVAPNSKPENFKNSFTVPSPVQIAGKSLAAGSYEVSWRGTGQIDRVEILQGTKLMMTVPARAVLLNRAPAAPSAATRTNSEGALSLRSLRFLNVTVALYFDAASDSHATAK
jgi:hypothetical protein